MPYCFNRSARSGVMAGNPVPTRRERVQFVVEHTGPESTLGVEVVEHLGGAPDSTPSPFAPALPGDGRFKSSATPTAWSKRLGSFRL